MNARRTRPSQPSVPDDRRFRRRQVRAARKKGQGGRIPWKVVRGAITVLLAAAAALVLGHRILFSRQFQVQRMTIHGNTRLSTGEVMALLEGLRGRHVLQLDLEPWRVKLLGSPWVKEARLQRQLPGAINVTIVERTPMATARMQDRLFLIGEDGTVIDEYGPQYADIDLPIIDGLARAPGEEDPLARARASLVARVLTSFSGRRDLLDRISQVDVKDPRNAVVILDADGTRVHLGDAAFAERLHSYLELAPALASRVPEIDYVDVRFEPRIFVRPATQGSAAGRKTADAPLP